MTDVLTDLLAGLKDGRAGRQPDPSSTRGSRSPEEAPEGGSNSGPLHRLAEARLAGATTLEAPPASVNEPLTVAVTLPEQESRAMLQHRDELDASCGTSTGYFGDGDEAEAELEHRMWLAEKREQMGLTELQVWDPATGEVWEIPDLTPAQKRKVARSKRNDPKPKAPIEVLAEEEAPENPEPLETSTPAPSHPWRRYQDPAAAGERRAA